jgi:hypothetical protein
LRTAPPTGEAAKLTDDATLITSYALYVISRRCQPVERLPNKTYVLMALANRLQEASLKSSATADDADAGGHNNRGNDQIRLFAFQQYFYVPLSFLPAYLKTAGNLLELSFHVLIITFLTTLTIAIQTVCLFGQPQIDNVNPLSVSRELGLFTQKLDLLLSTFVV